MNPVQSLALVAAANRAPSVHNIQPARFRIESEHAVTLLEDQRRRLFIGDPEGKDNQKSLGAAVEGMALALSQQSCGLEIDYVAVPSGDPLREIARLRVVSGGEPDPLAGFADTRASYRGAFAKGEDRDHAALDRIAQTCPDLHIIEAAGAKTHVAKLFDDVSMEVLRENAYRKELVSWMRLSKSHPDYRRDGLSAEHMALSPFEAFGAGIVLGSAFKPLDKIGLAEPLVAEGPKVRAAAGIGLFHRPSAEPEFETGRRLYRVWLEIERAGLALCPMSVLADVPRSAQALLSDSTLGSDRKLVTVFRIGRRPHAAPRPPRARLPVDELIVRA